MPRDILCDQEIVEKKDKKKMEKGTNGWRHKFITLCWNMC